MPRSRARHGGSRRWLAALVGLIVLAGTASVAAASSGHECRDPYPCKRAWPDGLHGPFALKEVRNVQVRSHDGVLLDGWIAWPALPAGVRAPTVLASSPYLDYVGSQGASAHPSSPDDPVCMVSCTYWSESPSIGMDVVGVQPIHLIRRGYAVAQFSVRGTGSSGGCFELGGRNEELDQAVLIDWIAKQPWSNGRVGMAGLSYLSYTAWQAAVQAPPALKTIVTAGDMIDLYQFAYSPQGSQHSANVAGASAYDATMGLTAGALSGRPQFARREACPHATYAENEAAALVTGDRDAAYMKARNLSLRLPAVGAAVLDTTGYRDIVGHLYQADTIWGSLSPRTPRLQVRGWWAHEFPNAGNSAQTKLELPSGTVTWEGVVLGWLDYWLKGLGPTPRNRVLHQDQELRWHEATSWSPRPEGKQVLYLSGDQLAFSARQGSTSFRSAPPLDVGRGENLEGIEPYGQGVESSLCPATSDVGLSRSYLSRPVRSRTLLAGSPLTYLTLAPDQAGGIVTASLYDLAPDFACIGGHSSGARWVSTGSADLSFHSSPFNSRPFPVGAATKVRIDLSDVTYTLAPGHRLALLLSYGEVWERPGATQFPTVTVFGNSQLVVPVAEGTLGGKRPTQRYPQRPFTPRGYRD